MANFSFKMTNRDCKEITFLTSDDESLDDLEKYIDDILNLNDFGNPFRTVVSNLGSSWERETVIRPNFRRFWMHFNHK